MAKHSWGYCDDMALGKEFILCLSYNKINSKDIQRIRTLVVCKKIC